jgi:LemA protein
MRYNVMWWLILIIIVVPVALVAGMYNKLIKLKVRAEEAWSDIKVQLKRRYDLIPNLIETVKGFAKQEKTVLENVTKARTAAMSAKGTKDTLEKENALSGTLKTLFAVSENYPDLKSGTNFLELQRELSDTENKIQASRRFYNTNVRDLNIAIQTFPSNFIANMFKFEKKELFELADAKEGENPKVKF